MAPADVRLVGEEIAAAWKTVAIGQARAMRSIATRCRSYKASDWMFFVLCTAEAVLADRPPQSIYNIFMSLARACRLLFRPRGLSQAELRLIEKELHNCSDGFYTLMYARRIERLPLCRSVFAALHHVVPSLRACVPA